MKVLDSLPTSNIIYVNIYNSSLIAIKQEINDHFILVISTLLLYCEKPYCNERFT